jgi:hypothetical protein
MAQSSWKIPIQYWDIPSLRNSIHSGLSTLINHAKLLNKKADDMMESCVDEVAANPSLSSDFHTMASKIEHARKKRKVLTMANSNV